MATGNQDQQRELMRSGSTITMKDDLAQEVTVGQDLAPAAAAAAAEAEIKARIIHATKFPRDIDNFRLDVLKTAKRQRYALEARYNKPVGRKKDPDTGEYKMAYATGLSIKGVLPLVPLYKHVHSTARIPYEDDRRVLLTVTVTDVQNNVSFSTDTMIDKLVERREVKKGRVPRGVRENTYGETVYLMDATPDEVRNKVGAERSKQFRDNLVKIMPRDILEELWDAIDATLDDEHGKDPDAAKKKICDRFATLGVTPAMLKDYLQRPLDGISIKDISELTTLFNGLKEGQFTWVELMRMQNEPAEDEAPPAPAVRTKLRDRVLAEQAAATTTTPAPKA